MRSWANGRLFWPGMAISGIYSVKLDPKDITQFVGPVTHHFSFNPDHVWERQGEQNEFTDVAWIEGPWIYKHNGTYYLQYSASGTQWRTYAEGYYKSKNVQGPYEYAPNNPLLRRTDGIVTGPAHGSMVTGPDGNIWQFYTVVLRSGGRRIGMDRVTVDKDGNLTCHVTDTPQWAPGVVKDPAKGDSGSIIVPCHCRQRRQPRLQRDRHAAVGARRGEGSRAGRFRLHHRLHRQDHHEHRTGIPRRSQGRFERQARKRPRICAGQFHRDLVGAGR